MVNNRIPEEDETKETHVESMVSIKSKSIYIIGYISFYTKIVKYQSIDFYRSKNINSTEIDVKVNIIEGL
jgi:hypothetical protein